MKKIISMIIVIGGILLLCGYDTVHAETDTTKTYNITYDREYEYNLCQYDKIELKFGNYMCDYQILDTNGEVIRSLSSVINDKATLDFSKVKEEESIYAIVDYYTYTTDLKLKRGSNGNYSYVYTSIKEDYMGTTYVCITKRHAYGNGVVTKTATEYGDGVMTYTCKKCGNTMTETIPKIESNNNTMTETIPEIESNNNTKNEIPKQNTNNVKKVSISTAKISKAKNIKKKKVQVVLKKFDNAVKYQIKWCDNKNFQGYETKNSKRNNFTIKHVEKGRLYIKARVCFSNGDNKKWGKWSKVKVVKVKK